MLYRTLNKYYLFKMKKNYEKCNLESIDLKNYNI